MTYIGISRDTRTNDEPRFDVVLFTGDEPPCRKNWPLTYLGSHSIEEALAICNIPCVDMIVVDVEPPTNRNRIVSKGYDWLKEELTISGNPFMFLSRHRWLTYLPKRIPAEAVERHHTAEALMCAFILSPIQIRRNALAIECATDWVEAIYIDDMPEEGGAR